MYVNLLCMVSFTIHVVVGVLLKTFDTIHRITIAYTALIIFLAICVRITTQCLLYITKLNARNLPSREILISNMFLQWIMQYQLHHKLKSFIFRSSWHNVSLAWHFCIMLLCKSWLLIRCHLGRLGNRVCHHIRYLYAIFSAPVVHTRIQL